MMLGEVIPTGSSKAMRIGEGSLLGTVVKAGRQFKGRCIYCDTLHVTDPDDEGVLVEENFLLGTGSYALQTKCIRCSHTVTFPTNVPLTATEWQ